MKHVRMVSVARPVASGSRPTVADAKADLLNSVWRAWLDFTYAKKNETVA